MKKIIILIGVLTSLIIATSISAYFLIILPKIQKEKLDFEKMQFEQRMQEEKEKQEQAKVNATLQEQNARFEKECIANKKASKAQLERLISSCDTVLCAQNIMNSPVAYDPTNYIENCIDRKMKGLPTFDY